MYYQLTDCFDVSSDAEQTWRFFSNAENLPAITPSWLKFTIQSPQPIVMKKGTLLDYTIAWMGIPIKWRTKIIDWSPTRQFIDLQLRGPYKLWHHQHTFEPTPQGTRCSDIVIYALPGFLVDRIVHGLVVRQQLMEIFEFRRKIIGERLGWLGSIADVTIQLA